jgi:hypothetical protein
MAGVSPGKATESQGRLFFGPRLALQHIWQAVLKSAAVKHKFAARSHNHGDNLALDG